MCGLFFLSLSLVVSFHAVIFYAVQTTFISSSHDIFCLYFILLSEIPTWQICQAQREVD